MRVSEKGQVTIPKYLRDLAGIEANSEVVFSVESGRIYLEAKGSAEREADRRRLARFLTALDRLEGNRRSGSQRRRRHARDAGPMRRADEDMATLVDTNVLIDIACRDPEWRDWSRAEMAAAVADGALVINPVIFSEFSYRYDSIDAVDTLLDPAEFHREHIPWEAAFAAGRAFRIYCRNGGQRERTLPDFLIGAHAVVRGYTLLTRDPTGYRRHFPGLEIVAPDTHP